MSRQWISTLYLSEAEYAVFVQLPAYELKKKRYLYGLNPEVPIGIDEIESAHDTLWIAEVEFMKGQGENFTFPFSYSKEISGEIAYSGFELAKQLSTNSDK